VVEALGTVATTLFLLATAMQTAKVMRERHARGLSHGLIWMMLAGFTMMSIYVLMAIGWNTVLMTGYIGQLIMFGVITKFKYFPKN
jgi:uncharacterized protein with PQ loop repeat